MVAEALPTTLLSLGRYSRIVGANPVHFQGAVSTLVFPVIANSCQDVMPRYNWQAGDRVSHERLAEEIQRAESDIEALMGYWPAPEYFEQDVRNFPHFHRRDLWRRYGRDVRGARIAVKLGTGKIISPGQRAATLIGTATVAGGTLVYSDEDSDTFYETATITLPTTVTDPCEVHLYITGTSANPAWELRPVVSKSISGGILTIVMRAWWMINPEYQAAYPTTEGYSAINLALGATPTQYLTTVDVYRVYTDTTATSAVFYWEPTPQLDRAVGSSCGSADCAACALTSQNGCFHVRDPDAGRVVPTPATYNASTGAWSTVCFTACRDPDMVKFYYYAGHLSRDWLSGRSCDPLEDTFARAIAYMATARLERPLCSCANSRAFYERMRADMALVTSGGASFLTSERDLDNPFGTRVGEVEAYRMLMKNRPKQIISRGGAL